MYMKNIVFLMLVLMLVGCAAQVPLPVSKKPVGSLTVAEARTDTARFIGTEIRWGGVITRVENKAKETWIEIASRELRGNGQPKEAGLSGGRFIASFPGFADPVVYQVGRQLTVLGPIKGQTKRLIGEHEYLFPVVSVTASNLWMVAPVPDYYDYPLPWWYYDAWPYYPRSYPHYLW